MQWDRPAHILSSLCKHPDANWHHCTNQATHTKSRTGVCNKLRPSSPRHYAPHPRYLALYWKNKKRGGIAAGLPILWARRGGCVDGGDGVITHFLIKAAPVGTLCPARDRKPGLRCADSAPTRAFELFWKLCLVPESKGPLLSPFSVQNS